MVNDLSDLLRTLTDLQLRYVTERMHTSTDAEAADRVGVARETVSRWKAAGAPIDECVKLMRLDGLVTGREMMRRMIPKAIATIDDEMRRGGKRRLDAATQVLDRVGIAGTSNVDVGDNLADLLRQWRKPATAEGEKDEV